MISFTWHNAYLKAIPKKFTLIEYMNKWGEEISNS